MATRDIVDHFLDGSLTQARASLNETLQEKVRTQINMMREDHLIHFFTEQDEDNDGQRPAGDENVEKFIRKCLKDMGADSLDDLSPEQKKKLFAKVDAEFESEAEEDDENGDEDED